MSQFLTTLAAVATVVGGVATLGTLLFALTRRARLRRDEAQWRQILEADTGEAVPDGQRQLVGDLHRHVVAQLISLDLVATNRILLGWPVTLAVVSSFGVAGWVLADSVAVTPEASWGHHLVQVTQPNPVWTWGSMLAVYLLLSESFVWSAGLHSARHSIAWYVLEGKFPVTMVRSLSALVFLQAHQPSRTSMGRLFARSLVLGAAGVAAGVGGGVVVRAFFPGTLSTPIEFAVVMSMVMLIGLFSCVGLWRGLVDPPAPVFTSIALREEMGADLEHYRHRMTTSTTAPPQTPTPATAAGTAPDSRPPRPGAWLLAAVLVVSRRRRRR